MRTLYTDLNIQIKINNYTFHALNIVFERFQRSIPRHSHSGYEIHYISQGNGRVIIDGKEYPVTPNTLYVTGPGIFHEQYSDSTEPMSEYCIYLTLQKKTVISNRKEMDFLTQFEHTTFWYGQDKEDIHTLMQSIFAELENRGSGYMTQVETLIAQCIVKLIRNYEHSLHSMQKPSKVQFGPSNLMDRKYIIIEESFLYDYKEITLLELAKRISLSTRQTERLLKEHYQKTFLQKKSEAKMSAAGILLLQTSHSITYIAEQLGFSCVEHFSAWFKRSFGCTAREYRRQAKYLKN